MFTKDQRKAYGKRYYQAHKEQAKEYQREYQRRNRSSKAKKSQFYHPPKTEISTPKQLQDFTGDQFVKMFKRLVGQL